MVMSFITSSSLSHLLYTKYVATPLNFPNIFLFILPLWTRHFLTNESNLQDTLRPNHCPVRL